MNVCKEKKYIYLSNGAVTIATMTYQLALLHVYRLDHSFSPFHSSMYSFSHSMTPSVFLLWTSSLSLAHTCVDEETVLTSTLCRKEKPYSEAKCKNSSVCSWFWPKRGADWGAWGLHFTCTAKCSSKMLLQVPTFSIPEQYYVESFCKWVTTDYIVVVIRYWYYI